MRLAVNFAKKSSSIVYKTLYGVEAFQTVIEKKICGIEMSYFEKYWPSEKENQKHSCIEAARQQFLLPKNFCHDKETFNRQILERRYRALAKECHPDRKDGSEEAFEQLAVNLALLLALLEQDDKQDVVDILLKIQLSPDVV